MQDLEVIPYFSESPSQQYKEIAEEFTVKSYANVGNKTCTSTMNCMQECSSVPACFSFAYNSQTSECQLNLITYEEYPQHFQAASDFVIYDRI